MTIRVPKGFQLAGVHCGLKRDPRKQDLTLVVSESPAVAAGVYTQNLVYAAPVALDRSRTPSDRIRAVVICSGNGQRLHRRARPARRPGDGPAGRGDLPAAEDQALVLSTGVIGAFLPMERIAQGICRSGRPAGPRRSVAGSRRPRDA